MAEPIEPLDTSEVQNSLNELSSALQNFMSGTDTAGMMGIDRINEFVGSITSQLGSVPNELKTQANRLKNSLDNIISSVSVSSQTDALARLSNVISRVSDDLASESMGLSEAKNVTTGVIASLKQLQTDFQGNSDLLERALQSVTNRLNKNGTELQTLGEQLAAARSSGMAEEATRLQGQIENITQLNSTLQGIGAEIGTRLEIASEQLIKSAAVLSAAQEIKTKIVEKTEPPLSPVELSAKEFKTAQLQASDTILGMDVSIAQLKNKLNALSTIPSLAELPQLLEARTSTGVIEAQLKAAQEQLTATKTAFGTAEDVGDIPGMELATNQAKGLSDVLAELHEKSVKVNNSFKGVVASADNLKTQAQKIATEMNKSITQMATDKLMGGEGLGAPLAVLMSKIGAIFSELIKIASEGLRRATELGMSATEGVALEGRNRMQMFSSMFTFDTAKMASPEQLNSMQSAAMSTFVNMADGMQISSAGSRKFQQELQEGFRSEFKLTGESLRALSIVGATSAADFEEFRIASGRNALSTDQLVALVNKNSLSFLLFGNRINDAAARFERLGISLSAIQKGQESFVTNLDGGIDTIAQLNQLGANLDFGTLAQIAEFGTPEQMADAIRAGVPTSMLNSASVRSLFGQLMPGMDAETLLKMAKTGQSLDEIQNKLSEPATESGKLTEAFGIMAKGGNILSGTFGGLIGASVALMGAMYGAAAATVLKTGADKMSMGAISLLAGKMLAGVTLAMAAIAGVVTVGLMGRDMVKEGNVGGGVATGLLGGAVLGALAGAGLLLAIPSGGMSLVATGAVLGAATGTGIAVSGLANDAMWNGSMMSKYPEGELQATLPAGFGNKMLLDTRTGEATAFNNKDKFMFAAGTDLANDMIMNDTATKFPEGTLGVNPPDNQKSSADIQRLMTTVNGLVTAIQNANTTIRIDGRNITTARRVETATVDITRAEA
jgi:hypothetical protein